MNRARTRRVLATVATSALMALPASAALASPPDHANAGGEGRGRTTTEQDDDTDEMGASRHPSGKDRTDHQDARQGRSASEPDDDGRGPERNHGAHDAHDEDTEADQPGESGGHVVGDQDGNNGCGNDQDFEDDNEGWCLGGQESATHPDQGEGDASPTVGTPEDGTTTEEVATGAGQGDTTDDQTSRTDGGSNVAVSGTTDGGVTEDGGVAQTEVAAADVEATAASQDLVAVAGLQVVADGAPADVEVLGESFDRPSTPAGDAGVLGAPTGEPGSLPVTGASLLALGLGGLGSVGAGAALRRRGTR